MRRLKHWGWGYEDQQPSRAELEAAAKGIHEGLGFGSTEIEDPVPLEAVEILRSRLSIPDSLAGLLSDDPYERVSRSLGKAYRDVVRGFRGEFEHVTDLVARPADESDLFTVLDYCEEVGASVIPFGGGTSVVGGVEPRFDGPAVTIDLRNMDRVLELDQVSGAALIQAGATGPRLEDQLRKSGQTLRHYPQSFEYATLGGWLATRAGGHFATVETHIDDLATSIRALTPKGSWESFRVPGSGAGPSPDRMLLGSEGILGLITQAWVRVRPRPVYKSSCGVKFATFGEGVGAARELAQSGLRPSNCRLLDPGEAGMTGAGSGDEALLIVGFESAHVPVDGLMDQALEIVRSHSGTPGPVSRSSPPTQDGRSGGAPATPGGEAEEAAGSNSVSSWKNAFLMAPYLRDTFVACGVLSDTFETAITWDRFDEFHASVMEAARGAIAEAAGTGAEPKISCRFTHVYPDGPAPYFTILAPAKRGGEVEQWDEIKAAASEAINAGGGTITHHHAVGRDHRPWYDKQRPEPFAEALAAAKQAVDPTGMLNPGVLIDPLS